MLCGMPYIIKRIIPIRMIVIATVAALMNPVNFLPKYIFIYYSFLYAINSIVSMLSESNEFNTVVII